MDDWMGASVWRVGRTAEDRLMWRTGWVASVWRVGRTAEDRLMYGRSVKAATSGNGEGKECHMCEPSEKRSKLDDVMYSTDGSLLLHNKSPD